jgi:hypothetical protein
MNQNPNNVISYQAGAYYRPVSYHVPANIVRADVNFRPQPTPDAYFSTNELYGGCYPAKIFPKK